MLEALAGSGAGILLLGLLIGMQHALEADHVAAVSSIAARQTKFRNIVRHGAVWGLGHTVTLMALSGGAIAFGVVLNETIANWLELLVGIMLVGLGSHLIFLLIKTKIHFHKHVHKDGTNHFHAHSHRYEERPHGFSSHDHTHPSKLPIRTLLVGMMHGMAGSAALVILTAATVKSVPLGIGYVLLFGLGSIAGMAFLSALIALPLTWSAKTLTTANTGLQAVIGSATIILGLTVAFNSATAL